MHVITATGLTKDFGARTVFSDVTFEIDDGSKVGLVGKNGCGKTTLLKILVGEIQPDGGTFSVATNKRLGLLSQIPKYPQRMNSKDVILTAFEPLYKIKAELESLELTMSERQDDSLIKQHGKLSERFELLGGFSMDVDFAKIVNGLKIPSELLSQEFEKLSGGERTRINLARLLLQQTEILLLDEPTNHLDLDAIEWLEEFLANYKDTVLIVSHDRIFLDKVVTRVFELENGKLTQYSGSYTQYAEEKENRRQHQLNTYIQEQRKIKQLLDTARVMHERGTEKQHKTAFAMEKRAERIATVDKPLLEKHLKAQFNSHDFKGDTLFSLQNIQKSFSEKLLFSDVNLEVKGQERIAILGDNGAGKSTLLKILLEQETFNGTLRYNPSVKIGFLPQVVEFANPERSLLDTLLYELDISTQEARDRLGAFGFSADDVFKPVNILSGGEKSRLKLCLLMMQNVNLLLLDEPTNHLDIASREWIENMIAQYDQALVFVSHDRSFIGKFAQRIWLINDGKIIDYNMRYDKYKEAKNAVPPNGGAVSGRSHVSSKTEQSENKSANKNTQRKNQTKQRLLEKQLEEIEAQLAKIANEIAENATDAGKLQEIMLLQAELLARQSEVYEQWFAFE